MGRSITEGLYTKPLSRTGNERALSDEEVSKLEDDQELYSIRGEAPEGYYNAGTKKAWSKGGGYEDHQIFKKLPSQAKEADVPVEETPLEPERAGFTDPENLDVSPQMQDAKDRVQRWKSKSSEAHKEPYMGNREAPAYKGNTYQQAGLMDRIQNFNS